MSVVQTVALDEILFNAVSLAEARAIAMRAQRYDAANPLSYIAADVRADLASGGGVIKVRVPYGANETDDPASRFEEWAP